MRSGFFIVMFSIFTAGSALAQGTSVAFGNNPQDKDQPVEVTSESLSVDQNNGTALFTGNVIVGQGEMRLSAPRVLVIYKDDKSGIERLEARGGVTLVSGPDAAEGAQADYFIDDGTIVMEGDVLLTQGLNATAADFMTVFLDDGTARMTGNVKTILQPSGTDN